MNVSTGSTTSATSRTALAIVATASLLMASFAFALPVDASTEHCEDHSTTPKAEGAAVAPNASGTIMVGSEAVGYSISADGKTVTFDQAVEFCVKASTGESGPQSGTSYTVDFENPGEQTPAISYFVIYALVDEPPTEDEDNASLNIRKVDEEGVRLAGAVFTVEGMEGTFTTGANGHFCITGLEDDSEWLVTEIQAPEGYEIAEEASQLVEVDDDGDCNSPDAVFVNTLADEEPTEEEPTEKPSPREDTQGGNPSPSPRGGTLPDTAVGTGTGSPVSALAALVVLASLGLLYGVRVAEVRFRR